MFSSARYQCVSVQILETRSNKLRHLIAWFSIS